MRNMDRKTQLRHMSAGAVFKLCQILDERGWKEIMAIIPCDPNDLNSKPKYCVGEICLIQTYGEKNNKSFTEILFMEWGTSGRVRPTVETLLNVLIKAELFRAADYIAVDLLKEAAPERPTLGPAALANVDLFSLKGPNNCYSMEKPIIVSDKDQTVRFPLAVLSAITGNFDDTPYSRTHAPNGTVSHVGHKLGKGAFGAVYYGELADGKKVAIKKLGIDNDDGPCNQFETEISSLSLYKHPNLLPLLGYSCDTPEFCLIYEFMPNGSLEDRLAKKPALNWVTRVDIAVGVCRGIHYLHTAKTAPLIHRDIKTANILLDDGMIPRIGDFGLVKTSHSDSIMTSNIFGTSAYMAPEAFRGDVSVKTDVFSVGVVLLELLTSLPPYDTDRDGADLVTFVDSAVDDTIEPLLDLEAGWDLRIANDIFEITQQCLADKKKRPLIGEVLDKLSLVFENISHA